MNRSKNLRIGILVYGVDRDTTGISRYTIELIRALQRINTQCHIILLVTGELGDLTDKVSLEVIRLPYCRFLPQLMTYGQLVLRRVVIQNNLDIIHDLTGVCPLGLIPKHVKTVVTIHDVIPLAKPGYSSILDSFIYNWWLPLITKNINQFLTPSNHTQNDVTRYLKVPPRKILSIPLGVNPSFEPIASNIVEHTLENRYGIHNDFLLFIGHWTKRKNLVAVLSAFAIVSPKFPKLKLVLVGPSKWKKTPVHRISQNLGINGKIHTLGYVSEADLPIIYSGAKIFLFPSLYEGFGLPVLEAMACGIPVISSNCSSVPEVAGEVGVLINPHRVNELSLAIETLLNSPKQVINQKVLGLKRVEFFTWEKCAQSTLEAYES